MTMRQHFSHGDFEVKSVLGGFWSIPRSPSSAFLPLFLGKATQIDYRKKGTLILTSLPEDLDPM